MVTVMAFGSFDVLHPGHLFYLREAKRFGDKLVVVVAKDSTFRKIKGKEPKYNEKQRIEHVRDIPVVDKAVLGYIEDPYEIIEEINPDIICLGYDQTSYSEDLKSEMKLRKMNPKIYRMKPYKEHIYKSSKLKA